MSKILITGGSGFIGSNLVRKLSNSRNQLSLFVRKQSDLWRLNDIISDFEVHKVDISDLEKVKLKIREIKPDIVFHCAAHGVYPSQKNVNMIIQTNIIGSINLMLALEKYNDLDKFINLASYSEYGSKSIKDTETLQPITPYGITKAAQTHFVQYFALQKNLPAITLRIFHAYGPYEVPGRLIADIMIALIKKKTLNVSSLNKQLDLIYIDDILDALLKASKVRQTAEVFDIGSGKAYSIQKIINFACKIANVDLRVSVDKKRLRESDKLEVKNIANLQKARKILHWTPSHTIKQGLEKTFDFYKENMHLYELLL